MMIDLRRMRYLMDRLPMARLNVERAMSRATKCTQRLTMAAGGGGYGDAMSENAIRLSIAREKRDGILCSGSLCRCAISMGRAHGRSPTRWRCPSGGCFTTLAERRRGSTRRQSRSPRNDFRELLLYVILIGVPTGRSLFPLGPFHPSTTRRRQRQR